MRMNFEHWPIVKAAQVSAIYTFSHEDVNVCYPLDQSDSSDQLGVVSICIDLWRHLADPKRVGMIRCVLTDAFITPARRWTWAVQNASTPGAARVDDASFGCPHGCGAAKAALDNLHVFWTCPKLPELGIPEVQASQRMARAARRHCARGQAALWLRGLTALDHTHGLLPDRLDRDPWG